MAEVTDHKKRSIELPWATVVAVAFVAGGFFLYLNPLQTSRPSEQGGLHSNVGRPQDVDARLWQDPLRAASEHDDKVQWNYQESKYEKEQKLENDRHLPQNLFNGHEADPWILAVMVPGNAYAEYAEERLRIRQAVIEGLGTTDYVPDDGEHIGYVKIENGEYPDWGWHNMIVPFEWYHRDPFSRAERDSSLPKNVCILWLRDEEFRDGQPLCRLNSLLHASLAVRAKKISIIGPYSSTTLREMVKEVAPLATSDLLEGVDIWCATATAADELLLKGVEGTEGYNKIEELFSSKKQLFRFRRSTLTDDEVIKRLLDELQTNRYVDLFPTSRGAPGSDKIAVLSELDTFFGRALPMSLRQIVIGKSSRTRLLDPMWPTNVLTFRYLRGIDGMLPGSGVSSDVKSKPADQSKSAVARESTEGLNQSDYLRRFAAQLVKQDNKFRHRGENGIKAVGVLGSDIYDKLMVLEALRRSLPDAVFFTNNLDARLAHPDEWHWTRNLIVASPFGLTLRRRYQEVPPFRDSIQTAMYAATLLAANYNNLGQAFTQDTLGPARLLGPVRLYEIGRRGAFDLTSGVNQESFQPDSSEAQQWWNMRRSKTVSLIFLLVVVGLIWISWIILGRRTSSPSRFTTSSWAMFVALAVVSVFSVWLLSRLISIQDSGSSEPYSWTDGISVWPTETLRLLACLLSIFYILKTWLMLRNNERNLGSHFGLLVSDRKREPSPCNSHLRESLRPRIHRYVVLLITWWRKESPGMRAQRWLDSLAVSRWKCEKNRHVNAQGLWQLYVRSSRERIRFIRILPLVLCYFVAGWFLIELFGWPQGLARGGARGWDWWLGRLSAFCLVLLTFYVADAILLNRRLIKYLTEWPTDWPPEAFNNLRTRWSLEKPDVSSKEPTKAADPPSELGKPVVPPNELLVEYLDIDLIARRTQVVGGLIYYPFVITSLLILSRASIFDDWTWQPPLLFLIVFTLAISALSAMYLRRTAEQARTQALQRLQDRLIAYVAIGKGRSKEAQTIRETVNLINAENRGAFAAISQHPLLRALLLPSGSAGIWALLQYFPRLLAG